MAYRGKVIDCFKRLQAETNVRKVCRCFTSVAQPLPIPISGRKYLAGSLHKSLPWYISPPRDDFPLCVEIPDRYGAAILKAKPAELAKEINPSLQRMLLGNGAVLLKKLPAFSVEDFSEFFNGLGIYCLYYYYLL